MPTGKSVTPNLPGGTASGTDIPIPVKPMPRTVTLNVPVKAAPGPPPVTTRAPNPTLTVRPPPKAPPKAGGPGIFFPSAANFPDEAFRFQFTASPASFLSLPTHLRISEGVGVDHLHGFIADLVEYAHIESTRRHATEVELTTAWSRNIDTPDSRWLEEAQPGEDPVVTGLREELARTQAQLQEKQEAYIQLQERTTHMYQLLGQLASIAPQLPTSLPPTVSTPGLTTSVPVPASSSSTSLVPAAISPTETAAPSPSSPTTLT